MKAEEKIECLEKKLKQALSWWRTAEKKLSQKCAETKANQRSIEQLKSENAALRERLEKATLNRSIYYIATIWNDATMARRQEVRCRTVDYVCDKFVECNGLTLNWDEIYFTREAALVRLAELKGGEK